ncbi:MAG TPA: hypothetical protein VJ731_07370 [Terriglobales bacterium]|nr:hypothetical protein [Terriglobales bacterium]
MLRVIRWCCFLFFSVLLASAQQFPQSWYQEMRWRMIGPFRGGRTRAVAGVPSQPNVFYIGVVDGGVWKSTDYGRTWSPIFDDQPSQSIGAIAIPASDPNVIYVASGEGLQRPDLSVGDGIYKSTDAGKTWIHLGLRDGQQIPALAVDPRDPNRIFAAVLGHPYGPNPERGIFRSIDGGASWKKVLYKDENTGGSDVEIDPSNPNVVYAGMWQSRLGPWEDNNAFAGTNGGLFKSTDGGDTWTKLTKGLPDDLVQINVAIAPSEPRRLYATIATTKPSGYATGQGLGFYRSDDAGESWTHITEDPRPAMKIGGGDLPIPRADPKNPDLVYVASIVTVRSTDGGKTWSSIRGAPGGDDYQNLWINPEHPNIILLVADQGAVVSVNGGETWSSWYNQPTAQLYHVSVADGFPYKVCGGQQESGSVCTSTRGNDGEITFRDWHPVGVIEYGYVAPDPLNPDLVSGAGRNEVSKFHWSTGQVQNVTPLPIRDGYRTDRTEPIMFSPVDPDLLYYAANVLFKTTDGGTSWQPISKDLTRENPGVPASIGDQEKLNTKAGKQRGAIYALAPSFHNVNTIWAGTDDGLVWITRDGGTNWKEITPPGLSPWSKVTQISASRFDDDTAYVSVSRFRIDDLRAYIYRTHDGGKSWKQITNGLPDNSPVNVVREDTARKGLLFAGSETAVWVSFDDGDHWQSLQLNLPHTSMRDLVVHNDDLIVATHGRSFWILDDISALRQFTPALHSDAPHLFTPVVAYRVRRDTNTDTPLPADEPAGQNPPDGAVIDYFVPESSSGPVTLEILDAQGKLVRQYSSADTPEQTPEQLAKQLIPLYWLRPQRILPASPGMHRWVWDLHYTSPQSSTHEYPIAAVPHDTPRTPLGPLAVPGKYSVRLTASGKSETASLTVKMDPRVKVPLSDLQKQFASETDLSSAVTQSSEAVMQAQSIREQIEKIAHQNAPLQDSIERLDKEIDEILAGDKDTESESPRPSLSETNTNLLALYRAVGQADAAPTQAQLDLSAKSKAALAPLLNRWNEVKHKDIPALNQQLTSAGLPQLRLDLPPQNEAGGENEE